MGENNTKTRGAPAKNLEQIFHERERLHHTLNDIVADCEIESQSHEAVADKQDKQPLCLFELEIARDGGHLKLSAHEEISGE